MKGISVKGRGCLSGSIWRKVNSEGKSCSLVILISHVSLPYLALHSLPSITAHLYLFVCLCFRRRWPCTSTHKCMCVNMLRVACTSQHIWLWSKQKLAGHMSSCRCCSKAWSPPDVIPVLLIFILNFACLSLITFKFNFWDKVTAPKMGYLDLWPRYTTVL